MVLWEIYGRKQKRCKRSSKHIAESKFSAMIKKSLLTLRSDGQINNDSNSKRYVPGTSSKLSKKTLVKKLSDKLEADHDDDSDVDMKTDQNTKSESTTNTLLKPLPVPTPKIHVDLTNDIDIDIWRCCSEHERPDLLVTVSVLQLVATLIQEIKVCFLRVSSLQLLGDHVAGLLGD